MTSAHTTSSSRQTLLRSSEYKISCFQVIACTDEGDDVNLWSHEHTAIM